MNGHKPSDIDFVITWVDDSDPVWLNERRKYIVTSEEDVRDCRYRDWGLLRFWFRGIEKFAPWVHKIYFVTYGHYPKWLNVENPKIQLVKHEDFIPVKWLPTYSSRTIDLNLHRIPSLSRQYVKFDDDMFLTRPVKPQDFFDYRGMPCDTPELIAYSPSNSNFMAVCSDLLLINKHFKRNKSISDNIGKWISPKNGKCVLQTIGMYFLSSGWTGFRISHLPYSFITDTLLEIWEKEPELMENICARRFRGKADCNIWLATYWQLAKGTFAPRSPGVGTLYNLSSKNYKNAAAAVRCQKYKMLCLNDAGDDAGFEEQRSLLTSAFETILPDACSYELDV